MQSATRRGSSVWRRGLLVAVPVVFAAVGVGSVLAAGAALDSTAAPTTVGVRSTALGRVLVDGRGRTLYLFESDEFGRSVCYGKCAAVWPPLLTTAQPRARAGAKTRLLGTTKRTDGRLQVTYQGYPLYLFVKDSRPGQTLGQDVEGFGGGWYVLDALGRKIEDGRHGGDATVVRTRMTALGRVLSDGRGRTLYLFEADTGGGSACHGTCAAAWPPLLTTGKPRAQTAAQAALLGTAKRSDGGLQVTYHGHPLYYFSKDQQAGQTHGQALNGFGAEWYVLNTAGTKIEKPANSGGNDQTPPPTTTTGDDGYGYG